MRGRLLSPAATASGADCYERVSLRIPGERPSEGAALSPVGCADLPGLQAAPDAREGLFARRLRGARASGAQAVGPAGGKGAASNAEEYLRGRRGRGEDVASIDDGVSREGGFGACARLTDHGLCDLGSG